MIKIPLYQSTSSNFTQKIELNSQLVTLNIRYNVRNEFFHFTITDPDGNILRGIKIVPNYPLLRQSRASLNFTGDFIVQQDSEDVEDNITYDNFGAGWNFYYITDDELTEWEDDNGIST